MSPDSRFSYFLLQAHVAAAEDDQPAAIRLTIEDLGSGEKRVFASVPDFSRFLNRLVKPAGDEQWAPPADT